MKSKTMKSLFTSVMLVSFSLLIQTPAIAQQNKNQTTQSNKNNMQQVLIDRITVPANAKEQFMERLNINRNIIKQQPGFMGDEIFEQQDDNGNLVVVTIARWQNAEMLLTAKHVVQAEYTRSGFNLAEFSEKLNIKIERGIYQTVSR